jgi:hypothetical protein
MEAEMTESTTTTAEDQTPDVLRGMSVEEVNQAASALQARTILVAIQFRKFGNSKQGNIGEALFSPNDPQKEPNKNRLKLTKKLLDSPALEAINLRDSRTNQMLKKHATFRTVYRNGIVQVALGESIEIDKELVLAKAEREGLVAAACATFVSDCQSAATALGIQYNPADYPTLDQFRASFSMRWWWLAVKPAEALQALDAEVYSREVSQARSDIAVQAIEYRTALREAFYKVAAHLADVLKPDVDGKKKRLHKAAVVNLNAFLGAFETQDSTDDRFMQTLVGPVREAMKGVDAKALRSDEAMRASLSGGLDSMLQQLSTVVEVRSGRKVTFETDEASDDVVDVTDEAPDEAMSDEAPV